MRLLRHLFAIASFGLVAVAASAAPVDPKNGVDYLTLSQVQQTDSAKKVEVTEFFGYFCPHCNAFEPLLADWVKKQGDRISFKRVHVAFGEAMVPQQRMFYAIDAMGKTEELHKKIFSAIHVDRKSLATEADIIDFVAKQGVDKKQFSEVFSSFGVQTKALRATQMQAAYKIDGVPTIAIDGRYMTSPSIANKGMPPRQDEVAMEVAALQVMDFLVAKASKERGADAKPAPVSSSVKPVVKKK